MKKKLLALILALMMLCVVFASCNPTTEPDDGDTDPVEPQEQEEPYTKVVILAGQSNLYGCSYFHYITPDIVGEERYERLTSGFENVKIVTQTLISSIDEFDTVHVGQITDYFGNALFGVELGAAEALSARYPDEEIYFIKVAYGGSTLGGNWQTPSKGQTDICYDVFKLIADGALAALKDAGKNFKIVAMCWMQGESDASDSSGLGWHYAYEKNLTTFIADMRADFDDYALGGTLNFVDAYISDSPHWTYYPIVNRAKLNVANSNEHNYILNTLALDLVFPGVSGLTYNLEGLAGVDLMHYDSLSELTLGQMFGQQIIEICEKSIVTNN